MKENRAKFNAQEYRALISLMADRAYKVSEIKLSALPIEDKDALLQAFNYTQLFLVADLAAVYGFCDQFQFEKELFAHFYKQFPSDFLLDLRSSIPTA